LRDARGCDGGIRQKLAAELSQRNIARVAPNYAFGTARLLAEGPPQQ